MKLTQEALRDEILQQAGYIMPKYDLEKVSSKTFVEPKWIHLGAGNIFRAFLAAHQQQLLNLGLSDTGIIVAEGYDYEIVDNLKQNDYLTINVTLKSDGSFNKEIIGSVTEYLKMDTEYSDFNTLKELFRKSSLQMVSLTITEKGYCLEDQTGNLSSSVEVDFNNGPSNPVSYLGKLTSLLFERFLAGELPIALVSMDNMSHNGEKLKIAIERYVNSWVANSLVPIEFKQYIENEDKVTFPWTMIDKITPRPDTKIQRQLENDGLEDIEPIQTSKFSFVAPYVNGEETEYLIVEDKFPNGRPPLEETGIIFTDRDTVNKVERMKVTTCLNPLHTCLAIFGCLLDYSFIHDEMKDDDLVKMVKILGYEEGLPVVVDSGIIDSKEFIDEVINRRLPNPFIPDTPQRIASDTSQKLAIRFGETIKAYLYSKNLDVHSLEVIPMVYAGWLRYLSGIDDKGKKFSVSSDPMLEQLQPIFDGFELGKKNVNSQLIDLLSNATIFGINLVEVGLSDRVINYFNDMSTGIDAVRRTIQTL